MTWRGRLIVGKKIDFVGLIVVRRGSRLIVGKEIDFVDLIIVGRGSRLIGKEIDFAENSISPISLSLFIVSRRKIG